MLPVINQMLSEDKKVRFVFKEYPILSEDSVSAARAALAVNRLAPTKYFEYHTALMKHEGKFDDKFLAEAAKKLGISGDKFKADDTTWFGKTITVATVPYTITNVIDDQHLTADSAIAALAGLDYSVNYPISLPASDRNLTVYGSRMPATSVYALGDPIPFLPDSASIYLCYGILARVFASDTELLDKQKALFCQSRWQEGVSIFSTIIKSELLDDDYE